MSTKWTVERLEGLPEGTVIGWTEYDALDTYRATRAEGEWWVIGGDDFSSASLAEDEELDPGSIRVVSVPIDALLADETVRAIARAMSDDWNPDRDPVLTAMFQDYAQTATRAAVAHVTGGAR